MMYIILLILLIISIISLFIIKRKYKKEILNLSYEKINEIAKDKIIELDNKYNVIEQNYKNEIIKLQEEQKELTNNLFNITNSLKEIKNNGMNEINEQLELYKKQSKENITLLLEKEQTEKKKIIDKEMDDYRALKEKMNNEFEEQIMAQQKLQKDELDFIIEEIKDYEKKREVINKQILMERELKEQSDFYRIMINENEQEDIKLINSFQDKFHNKEALNRIIFDFFIKKPMTEMIKRVLKGSSPSGIYMITDLLTNEIYIGRAVSIDKRWQEHCKSCFNIGTIAHSTLHTRMAKDGIWNFSFQVLEEVPKDKLSEREKYWINFYQTKEYGLNERQGG